MSNQHLLRRAIMLSEKRSTTEKRIVLVDNETSNSMIHFGQTIRHKWTFPRSFMKTFVAHLTSLSTRCNFINEISCLLSRRMRSAVQKKLPMFLENGFDLMILLRRWFHEMDFVSNDNKASHRIRALFQFQSLTGLSYDFLLSFLWNVIIIVSEAGDRTKKQLKFQSWVFRTSHAFWPWKLVH